MKSAHVYQHGTLTVNATLILDSAVSHHLLKVLRLKVGDVISIFNGEGGEYQAEIIAVNKNQAVIKLKKFHENNNDSPLKIHLGQGIARGEKMDLIIQKAVELGVNKITPLFTEFGNVKLASERLEKRLAHWRAVAIAACEQCGRNTIPEIATPCALDEWVTNVSEKLKIVLQPEGAVHLNDLPSSHDIAVLVGTEGGISEKEVAFAKQQDFLAMQLGPRILRTETAGLAILAALQSRWGDLR